MIQTEIAWRCGETLRFEFEAPSLIEAQQLDRMRRHAREWSVGVKETFETETSVICFGTHDQQPVVLKLIKRRCDEWCSGEILEAFDGHGVVRVLKWTPGAVLTERLQPGNSLVEMALNGRDEEATDILADVMLRMSARASSISPLELPEACATLQEWSKGFERYRATGDDQIPANLVAAGERVYLDLSASQARPRLLHGDLQHYNVLFDSELGWLSIDPKGVVGEVEYEIGAALRNPFERPELFLSPGTIERRLRQFTSKLNLNYERALGWSFAQAVLSAIWEIEDGFKVDATNPSFRLAEVIWPMLGEAR